jgi:hypothetical protein
MKSTTKYVFITISINLLIAFLVLASIIDFDFKNSLKFILDTKLNLSIGIFGLYFTGYLIGNKLFFIKEKKSGLKVIHGILSIFLILLLGTLIGSSVGWIQEGLPSFIKYGNLEKSIFDYYIKPLFWIMFFGFIPTLISGFILGYHLKKLK